MSLKDLRKEIEKETKVHGFFLNEGGLEVDVISTGQPELDEILGIGGMPRGGMVETAGNESSGKTTLWLHVAAETQKIGGAVVYIDMEHALVQSYAETLGVVFDDTFLLYQPDCLEEAMKIGQMAIGEADLIVIDSVASLVPRAELEGDFGDSHMGLQARLISQACRKISPELRKTKTIWAWINQIRTDLTVRMGDNRVAPGGNAIPFYSDIRIWLYAPRAKRDSLENEITVDIRKNKKAPPARSCKLTVVYGRGFDPIPYYFNRACAADIITGRYLFPNDHRESKKEDSIEYLRNNEDILQLVKDKLKKKE